MNSRHLTVAKEDLVPLVGKLARWIKRTKHNMFDYDQLLQEYDNLYAYIQEMNIILRDALRDLARHDPERAAELAERLDSYTTKTLYDHYWRLIEREEGSGKIEHG